MEISTTQKKLFNIYQLIYNDFTFLHEYVESERTDHKAEKVLNTKYHEIVYFRHKFSYYIKTQCTYVFKRVARKKIRKTRPRKIYVHKFEYHINESKKIKVIFEFFRGIRFFLLFCRRFVFAILLFNNQNVAISMVNIRHRL